MLKQDLLAGLELEVGEEAETDLQPAELVHADASHAREARVRIAQVLVGLHGDAQAGEDEAVAVAAGDGDGALLDGELVDVEAGGKVDGRRHGAELVNAHEVVLERDGRRVLGVEFPRDGAMLDVQGLGVVPDDDVWLHGRQGGTVHG